MALKLGYCFIITGLLIILTGIIGLIRLQGFYNKVHATSLIEIFGIPITIIGLIILKINSFISLKLLIAIICIITLNPVTTHSMTKIYCRKKNVFKNKLVD